MRVRCRKIIGQLTGKELTSSGWLTIGNEYVVLEVYISNRRGVEFRLLGDNENGPALFSAEQFEVTSSKIPLSWGIKVTKSGLGIELGPEGWWRKRFWEDYYDQVPEAWREFQAEYERILKES